MGNSRAATRLLAGITAPCLLALAGATTAAAAKMRFGAEETLTHYADTGVEVGGEKLSLCYKATTQWFLLGAWTTDEAVLCDRARRRYWALPEGDQLKQLQAAKRLPDPIPPYDRPFIEYAFGYSLWVLGGLIGVGIVLSRGRARTATDQALKRHKVLVRRVMAETLDTRPDPHPHGEAAALSVYERVFSEPMAAADLAAEREWVRTNPDTYRAYLGVVSKNVDTSLKLLLLRIATALTFELGRADDAGWAALVDLAGRLDLDEQAVHQVVAEIKTPPQQQQRQAPGAA